jgi:hypothetical protein
MVRTHHEFCHRKHLPVPLLREADPDNFLTRGFM